jgi:hypothetical protein
VTAHGVQPNTPAHRLAAGLITDKKTPIGRHRQTFLGTQIGMARARQWHAFWCRLGDVVDEISDIAIAWATVVLGAVAVVAVGAVIGFAGGPVAAAAYVLAVSTAAAALVRWGRRQP